MNNPFASLDLHLLRVDKSSGRKTISNLNQQLEMVDISKPNGARDRVVLLLRNRGSTGREQDHPLSVTG